MARNREFYRDRSAFLWNILFPFLIIAGFGFIFNDSARGEYHIGFIAKDPAAIVTSEGTAKRFFDTKHIMFIRM